MCFKVQSDRLSSLCCHEWKDCCNFLNSQLHSSIKPFCLNLEENDLWEYKYFLEKQKHKKLGQYKTFFHYMYFDNEKSYCQIRCLTISSVQMAHIGLYIYQNISYYMNYEFNFVFVACFTLNNWSNTAEKNHSSPLNFCLKNKHFQTRH